MLDFKEYREKISKLSSEERKKRDLYLKGLATGSICGPQTGKPSIDKPWLKYHSDEAILCDIPKKTIYQNLFDNSQNHLSDIAIMYFGRKITYEQLFANIDDVAKALSACGLKYGDVITLLSVTTPEAIYLFYAANKMGITINLLDPRTNESRIKEMCDETNSKYVFVIEQYGEKIKNALKNSDCKIVDLSAFESLPLGLKMLAKFKTIKNKGVNQKWNDFIKCKENMPVPKTVPFDENHTACIDYTGGTTGIPKGAKLTDYNMNAITTQYSVLDVGIERGQKMLNIMPMFLAYGINMLNMSLNVGVTNVLIPNFKVDELDKFMLKYKPEHFMGVPVHFEYLLKSEKMDGVDLGYWKTPAAGGDSTALTIEQRMLDFLKNHNSSSKFMKGYGLTEMSSAAATTTISANSLGSVGIPLVKNNFCVRSFDSDQECRYNELGELYITGPSMMQEYFNNPEETQKAIVINENGERELHTGDIGYIDENGLLFIKDRKKRVIIRPDGHNVFPSTIENVIRRHPAVKNCAVIKSKATESISGSWAKAVVVLKDEYLGQEDLVEEELKALCLENLPERDVAQFYSFVDSLPYTGSGKVDTLKLEQQEELAKEAPSLVRKK